MTTTRTIRLTDDEIRALELFAEKLDIYGQRDRRLNALIKHLAATVSAAMPESIAAYEIATGCAAGEDWHDLIEAITPKHTE